MEPTNPETVTFFDPISGMLIEIPVLPEAVQGTVAPIVYREPPSGDWEGPVATITGLLVAVTALIALLRRRKDGS